MLNHFYKFCLAVVFSIFCETTLSQEIPIGTWRDHLSYTNTVSVTKGGGDVYCASESAVFTYNIEDNSLSRLNLITGLSEIGVKTIKYNTSNNKLIVAYTNGNVDIIDQDKRISNLPFIKNSNIIADKTINDIYITGKYAYLSTGFGIVLIDTDNEEIVDTYFFGPLGAYLKTNAITIDNQYIYAATENGVFFADKNSLNLADYNEWSHMSELGSSDYSKIVYYNNKLVIALDNTSYGADTVYFRNAGMWEKLIPGGVELKNIEVSSNKLIVSSGSAKVFNTSFVQEKSYYTYENVFSVVSNSAYMDANGELWLADQNYGLIRFYSEWDGELISPNGPNTSSVFRMDLKEDNLWITSGGYGQFRKQFPFNYRKEGEWQSPASSYKNPDNGANLSDFISVIINPMNTEQTFIGTWGKGLIEFNSGALTSVYTAQSSPLDSSFFGSTSVGAMDYDSDNNLWISSSFCTDVLSVRTSNNDWYSYALPGFTKTDGYYDQLIVDQNNFVWFIDKKYNKVMVYDANGTLDYDNDDRMASSGQIDFGTFQAFSLVEDLDGEIWFGTSTGIGVLQSPGEVFNSVQTVAPIYIQQDGQTQLLLESETVTSIAVDGANRKWIGTQSSGVFLMSEDGTEEVEHFTTTNSPLFSDNIYDIKINGETGEVFIATEKGLISYKGTATDSNDDFDNVFVYPNPVHPDYSGVIAIRGLTTDTDVRITDISGNMVFQTKSLGGQAIWNGKDLRGNRVQSGVYMVFNATKDGELKAAAKILFIH